MNCRSCWRLTELRWLDFESLDYNAHFGQTINTVPNSRSYCAFQSWNSLLTDYPSLIKTNLVLNLLWLIHDFHMKVSLLYQWVIYDSYLMIYWHYFLTFKFFWYFKTLRTKMPTYKRRNESRWSIIKNVRDVTHWWQVYWLYCILLNLCRTS